MRVLPHGIAILLCISAIYCAPSSDESILRTLASIQDVDPINFLNTLLKMRKSGGFNKEQPISQLILSRSDIPDDIYRAMIQVLWETRKELRAGDSSLTTLNSLIWLNTHNGQEEILDLTDAILRGVHSPKATAFSIQDLARDMAMRRLPRRRNAVKTSRARRAAPHPNEPLTDVLFELKPELQLNVTEAIPELSELERNVIEEKIRNLFHFFLNKLHEEMLNGTTSIIDLYYSNTESFLQESGYTLLNNGLESMEQWREAQRAKVREIFIRAIETIHEKVNSTLPMPELRVSEHTFLEAIRGSIPTNLEHYEPDHLFQLIYIVSGNLTKHLKMATNLEYPELEKEIERNISKLQDEYLSMMNHPKYLGLYNPHTGRPVVQEEELLELFRMSLEQIVEAVRERYRGTLGEEPAPVAPEVEEFIKEWYEKKGLESLYNKKIATEIAWTRERLGDYQFQKLGAEFFEKTMEWKTSRVESEDWMKILRQSHGEDLVDLLRELKTLLIGMLQLRPDQYNFIENFERTEVDRDETLRFVKAFEGLIGPSKSSQSIARLLYDVSTAESKADFKRILHVHTIFHDYGQEVLHAGLQKIEKMKKTVKNPRKFTEFLRNVATVVATKKMEKEHFYHLLAEVMRAKTSLELQNTLVSLARLLHVFDTQTVMNGVQKPSEDPEVLAAYEVLTRNGGVNMAFVRSFMKKYENETVVVRTILKELGVDPDSIKEHNRITASMDVLIELMEAASTYPNLQRLLAAAKEASEADILAIVESRRVEPKKEEPTEPSSVEPTAEPTQPSLAPAGASVTDASEATEIPDDAPNAPDAPDAPAPAPDGPDLDPGSDAGPVDYTWGPDEFSLEPELRPEDFSLPPNFPEEPEPEPEPKENEDGLFPDTSSESPDDGIEIPLFEKRVKRGYEHKLHDELTKDQNEISSRYQHKLANNQEQEESLFDTNYHTFGQRQVPKNSKYENKLAKNEHVPLKKPGHHHFHIPQSDEQGQEHKIKKRSIRLTGLDDPNKLDLDEKEKE